MACSGSATRLALLAPRRQLGASHELAVQPARLEPAVCLGNLVERETLGEMAGLELWGTARGEHRRRARIRGTVSRNVLAGDRT